MVELTIGPMEAGKKVHRLVRQLLPGVPLSGIHKMIRTGRIKKNGKKAKSEDVLIDGDVIKIFMAESDYEQVSKPEKKFRGVDVRVDVAYEDEQVIVVNKPAGLLVHGAEGEHKHTLVNQVLAYLYQRGDLQQSRFTPSPVNRLDRNTSGLVVFGKSAESTRTLAAQVADHHVRKWYLAIVKGALQQGGEIHERLERDIRGVRTSVSERGKSSTTRYRPVVSTGRTTVVLVELVSGRTHQIRAHFEHIRYPLWGDVKYGGAAPLGRLTNQSTYESTRSPRSRTDVADQPHQWLHAGWLQLPDQDQLFHATLPEPFRHELQKLGYRTEQIQELESLDPTI